MLVHLNGKHGAVFLSTVRISWPEPAKVSQVVFNSVFVRIKDDNRINVVVVNQRPKVGQRVLHRPFGSNHGSVRRVAVNEDSVDVVPAVAGVLKGGQVRPSAVRRNNGRTAVLITILSPVSGCAVTNREMRPEIETQLLEFPLKSVRSSPAFVIQIGQHCHLQLKFVGVNLRVAADDVFFDDVVDEPVLIRIGNEASALRS